MSQLARFTCGVLCLWASLGFNVATAGADPPDCPPRPGAYTGSDPVVEELRSARQDAADTCLALVDRIASVRAEVVAVSEGVTALNVKADTLHADNLEALVSIDATATATSPLHDDLTSINSTVAEHGSAGVVSADEVGAALHADLWFLIGLSAAMLSAYGIYRQVMPRA